MPEASEARNCECYKRNGFVVDCKINIGVVLEQEHLKMISEML